MLRFANSCAIVFAKEVSVLDKKIIGDRIKTRRKELDLTLSDIAGDIGVAISTVQRYEAGTIDSPKIPVIEAIARSLRVAPDWLIGKSNMAPSNIALSVEELRPIGEGIYIPLYGRIACGTPIIAVEELDEVVWMPDGIHADFALTCVGDSMINARIFDGDIVYIHSQPIVENGEIAAVIVNGDEVTLKRIYYYPENHEMILQPENPLHTQQVYTGSALEQIRIVGKAVHFLSKVR